ncbi:MAG: enterochelin esterase-like enzyme [Flavobacteriales bacterium]|jgi:enterochelin esterase-like enzyme
MEKIISLVALLVLLLSNVVALKSVALEGNRAAANKAAVDRAAVDRAAENGDDTRNFIYSKAMGEERELYVHLPSDYAETTKAYPLVILLDANLSYMPNIFDNSLTLIDGLIQAKDIPASIVVGIPSQNMDTWFDDAIDNKENFIRFITKELLPKLHRDYRVLNKRILVGQSYSGALVSNLLAQAPQVFDTVVAIDPIFSSKAELQSAIDAYVALSTSRTLLYSMQSGGDDSEIRHLQKFAAGKDLNIRIDALPLESHQSIYYPALKRGLRLHFSDFRLPNQKVKE